MDRRTFLARAAGAASAAPFAANVAAAGQAAGFAVDFRYAPQRWQTAYCFPDDPCKSLVGDRGQLLCGHAGQGSPIDRFATVVEFALLNQPDAAVARQELEAPGVPVVHTRVETPQAFLELTTFASRRAGEGRVDNVVVAITPRARRRVHAIPLVTVRGRQPLSLRREGARTVVTAGAAPGQVFMVADRPLSLRDTGWGYVLSPGDATTSGDAPFRCLLRFPQAGQAAAPLLDSAADPDALLAETRAYWREWQPFGAGVAWSLPGVFQNFLTACARNIVQAREVKDGRLTFQVGPTVYRGLWVVDGNFLLESARYLGYDGEAQQGLEATWARQQPSGAVTAGAGEQHWKDTAIAMFTLARQAELQQEWSYLRRMRPEVLRGVAYLSGVRDRARNEPGSPGRYGILARGFADGGLGLCAELTNTVWSLAGLKAIADTAARQRLDGFEPAARFGVELRAGFDAAARGEMRRHPEGFDYLHMVLKDDPLWNNSDDWSRLKPQAAQWALSQAIYPGIVFAQDDPVVKGHIALMQAATAEDVPAETGWLHNEGLWTYNAGFAAHAYLWAGVPDWARLTFRGFLNHATPLWAWREEQPLAGSLAADYVGDMPHNWASAECVLYLRHMLALEDGGALRLLEGIGDPELAGGERFAISGSPTRFGRIALELEPVGTRRWRLKYSRGAGAAPDRVHIPASLGSGMKFAGISGASAVPRGNSVEIAPAAASWEAVWTA